MKYIIAPTEYKSVYIFGAIPEKISGAMNPSTVLAKIQSSLSFTLYSFLN